MAKPTRVAKSTTAKAMKSYPSLTNTTGRLLGQVPDNKKQAPKNKYGAIIGTASDRLAGAVALRTGKSINTQLKSGAMMELTKGTNSKFNLPTTKPSAPKAKQSLTKTVRGKMK